MEAPSTLLLALLIYREHLGRRAAIASIFMFAGAVVLALAPHHAGAEASTSRAGIGALLVFAATLAWAMDNVLSRPLADRDPLSVVAGKGLIGGAAAAIAALALADRWPAPKDALALLAIGGLGYGVSLQLYLRAQRMIGTARTASLFAAAPFLGAATALLLGAPWPGTFFLAAALLIGAGVYLHSSEHHHHQHSHPGIEHEHTHSHADGHHQHTHDPMPAGPHSHLHQHQEMRHDHEHSEDLHHHHQH